jgi:hypothetical protein
MNEPNLLDPHPPAAERSWGRRLLLWLGLPLLLLAGGAVGLYFLAVHRADADLQEAVAEADRLDPGWRLDELEAKRAELPDDQNAALTVMAARSLLPRPWPPSAEKAQGGLLDEGPSAPPLTLDERLTELPPEVQLDPALTEELRAELKKVGPALAEARKLRDMKEGRYPIGWMPNVFASTIQCQDAREVAHLLRYQAMLQAQDRQAGAALDTARALLTTARSVGDEPFLVSQLVRLAVQTVTVESLERTLAQGRPGADDLKAVQHLLEKEAAEPLLLFAARGERANAFQMAEDIKTGKATASQAAGLSKSGAGESVNDLVAPARVRLSEPRLLRFLTECVEIAKLPPEQQGEHFAAMERKIRQARAEGDNVLGLLMPAVAKVGDASRRTQARLRCAIVALALERYRLDHGRWPERLDQLAPQYLTALPRDPCDGRALRYKALPDGVLVYSVGLDGEDNGGALNRREPGAKGADVGFRLWDPPHRRQAPAEMLPMPAEGPGEDEPLNVNW